MSYIILKSSQDIKIKVNEKIYEEFSNLKNYNKDLMNFDNKKNIIIKNKFINNSVPNIIRYQVDILKNTGDITVNSILNKKNIIKNSNYSDILLNKDLKIDKSITLILESPHKAEFEYFNNYLKPISPAQGSTGKNIDNKLQKLLVEIISNNNLSDLESENYKLVIINPISFQTSLHFFHRKSLSEYHFKKLRDKVWQESWEKDITYKKNLSANLKKINSNLIINACTSNLSPLIQEFLENNFKNKHLVKSYHPSAWIFSGFGLK